MRRLVVVPNSGLYGFGRVPLPPNSMYKWAFNFWNVTIAKER